MYKTSDILIVGGGLAGLTASIHLSKLGYSVVLIERQTYPHHKVCGEYVSNEILPYFDSLDIDLSIETLPQLKRLQLTTENGKELWQNLPLGGFGISRYNLDQILYKKAIANGVNVIFDKVEQVQIENEKFYIEIRDSANWTATQVIGAWGKRSNLDKTIKRSFIQKNAEWMGVKSHYKIDFEEDVIALHNFKGGYCGMSKVENDVVNACYLVDTRVFKQFGSIEKLQENILMQNPHLNKFLSEAEPLFKKPLIISQVSFAKKSPIEKHILMVGDSAGLIHPLCGNGMAMAIGGARLAVNAIHLFFSTHKNRQQLESEYSKSWQEEYNSRLKTGRLIQKLLLNQKLAPKLMGAAQFFPSIVKQIIKKTHGKPITIND